MSDSTISMAQLRAQFDANIAKAQREYTLITETLEALPEQSPVPVNVYPFGYCAEAGLSFSQVTNEQYQQLFKLYPPIPAVYMLGDCETIKPVASIRGHESSWAHLDIFPVSWKDSGKLRWWTLISNRQVEITAEVARGHTLQIVPGNGEYYSTGNRYVKMFPKATNTRPLAIDTWVSAWSAFVKAQNWNQKQLMFVNTCSNSIMRGQPMISKENLPDARAQPLKGIFRTPHEWDRNGIFWDVFTEAESVALLEFYRQQFLAYPAAVEATQKEMDTIQVAFNKYFETHGVPFYRLQDITIERILRVIQSQTGLNFIMPWLMCPERRLSTLEMHIRISANCREVFRDFTVTAAPGILLPQDVTMPKLI